MSIINFSNTRQMEGLFDAINPIKELIESKINLSRTADREKRINLNQNKIMRICLLAGLSSKEPRDMEAVEQIQLSKTSNRIFETLFTLHNLGAVYSALLTLRYNGLIVDWEIAGLKSKVVNSEIIRGSKILSRLQCP